MPKEEPTQEEAINTAIDDVRNAMLANVEANRKLIEINREKTAARFTLQKAKQRLSDLEKSFN